MEFTSARVTSAVAWVVLIGLVGAIAGAASILQWTVLASIAIIPPVLARTLCRLTARTALLRRHEVRR